MEKGKYNILNFKLYYIIQGENMLALYEMIENERNEIYSTGIKEGKVKGKIEGIKAIAKKMLRMKFDKDTIMKATGIKEEELEKMKK